MCCILKTTLTIYSVCNKVFLKKFSDLYMFLADKYLHLCVDMCIYISHVSWEQIFLRILLRSIQNLFFVIENEGEKLVKKTNLTPNGMCFVSGVHDNGVL